MVSAKESSYSRGSCPAKLSAPANYVAHVPDVARSIDHERTTHVSAQEVRDAEPDFFEVGQHPLNHASEQFRCEGCGGEDPNGLDCHGTFWCLHCWQRLYNDRLRSKCATTRRYEALDPILVSEVYTKFAVRIQHFLQGRTLCTKDECLVLLGSEFLVDPEWASHMAPPSPASFTGVLRELCASSDFVKCAPPDFWPAPRWGGIYAPAVTIVRDSWGQDVDAQQCAVLYAASPWGPRSGVQEQERFRTEMREKVSNVLRICYLNGHRKIIVASRFSNCPTHVVANVFRDALCGVSDTRKAFLHVEVLLQPSTRHDMEEKLRIFKHEFEMP